MNSLIVDRLVKRRAMVVLAFLISVSGIGVAHADWGQDFLSQRPSKRPTLESRYASAKRDAFLIEADHYTVGLNLGHSSSGHRVPFVAVGEEKVFENGWFELEDATGKVWDSRASKSKSRINLYRRGPYYHEVHWLDVVWTDENNKPLPIKGEIVWFCYPDTFRMGLVLHATEDVSVGNVTFRWGESSHVPTQIPSSVRGASSAWFPTIEPKAQWRESDSGSSLLQWTLSGSQKTIGIGEKRTFGCGFVASGSVMEFSVRNELLAQLNPLSKDRLKLIKGLDLSFDSLRGDYVISTHNPGGFSYHYYKEPNGYLHAKMQVLNDEIPRRIYIRHEVGTGSKGQVECGVVLNEHDEVVPVQVQISKNFAGEKEEKFYNPQDTPFSEIIFPIHLKASEQRTFSSLQLYQNWGNHPLKQFSSLGAWMDYYHMSTGVTETTCYVPFQYHTGISIADLRGMSGRMWESQPQHDNVGGHIFMEYQPMDLPGKTVALEYLGTRFHSTGPNWAHVTLSYLTTDGRLKVDLETFEYPQVDELRNFIRLRFTALDDIPIKDWSRDFRLMQIDTRTQSLRYQNVTWVDQAENTVTRKLNFNDSWTLSGESLGKRAPAAVLWNSPKGNNAFIVEEWRGKIGGKPVSSLGISCEGRKSGDSNLVLHPVTDVQGLKKGESFEVDFFIMPFGKEQTDFKPALIERQRYGLNPVELDVQSGGKVISSFPPRVRWNGHPLEFSITGGYSTMVLLVEGLPDFNDWALQKKDQGDWGGISHADDIPVIPMKGEGEQRFVCEDGSFGIAFRLELGGNLQRYRIIKR